MEAKAKYEKVRGIATFSTAQKHQLDRGFMFHDRAEAAAVHTRKSAKASMTANKPFETYKEVFGKNSIKDFPALSNPYPSNSTPKLIDQELVEDLQHVSIRQPRCFAKFCSFKGRDMDP